MTPRGRPHRALTSATVALLIVAAVVLGDVRPSFAQDPEVTNQVTGIERRVTGLVRRVESISGDVRTAETPEQVEVTLGADVLFDFDQATLTPAAAATIDEVAAQLEADGTGAVTVVGHTDAKGTDAYNQDLSLRRATSVRDALAARAGAFTYVVDGKGAAEPVAPNTKADGSDDPDGRARNRRVTITYARQG